MSQPPPGFRPGQHLEILDDPIHDPYQARLKLTSPTVCSECGARYTDGRWRWARQVPPGAAKATCPACQRIRERQPGVPVGAVQATLAPRYPMRSSSERSWP